MDKNQSSQDTPALTRQPPADQVQAIDQFVGRFYWAMVATANRMIRLRQIDQALYDGEDAVVTAWYKLRKAADGGKLAPIQTSGHLWRLFHSSVNREIRTERDRSQRRSAAGKAVLGLVGTAGVPRRRMVLRRSEFPAATGKTWPI